MPDDATTNLSMSVDGSDRAGGVHESAGVGYVDPEPFEMVSRGHRFRFFPAGVDRLAALIAQIEKAERSIEMFFYMFQPDAVGKRVRDALVAATMRGVDVHLIIDAFGSDAPRSFFAPLVDAGARFDLFQPRWNVRYLIRNHQKFIIVDGKRAITGGFNIAEDYFTPPCENGWCDLAVLIEGSVVTRFGDWFVELRNWIEHPRPQFRTIRRAVREWEAGDGLVQLVLGGPTRIESIWARRVMRDLAQARRLDMVMAYFSPPRRIRQLIEDIADRGAARLIMAGKTDNGATIGASRALYASLRAAGVGISEFTPCKLHMKVIVVDDITYVGSANMDMRSTRLNLELMLRIEDAELAMRMRAMIDHLVANSTTITDHWYRQRATWLNRLRWRLSNWLVTVFDYTIVRRLNFGF